MILILFLILDASFTAMRPTRFVFLNLTLGRFRNYIPP